MADSGTTNIAIDGTVWNEAYSHVCFGVGERH